MKKLRLIVSTLFVIIFCMPVISGCKRNDPNEHRIEFDLPSSLPAHIKEVLLESNHAVRDDGTIFEYSYTDFYPENVKMRITCERGYMPDVQFTLKTKGGELIRTVTEENILEYDYADYDDTATPKKEQVMYRLESFMTESPKCDLVLTIDKLEAKTAEHTLTFENVNWVGNPTDHFAGELSVSFSGALPTVGGQPAVIAGHKYEITELSNLFKGAAWTSRYGDQFSMTVHFSEREVPPSLTDNTDEDFQPLFYAYEVRNGQRWDFKPVDIIEMRSTSTTLTAIFKIDWDYSINLIVEPFYRLCPIPEA